MLDPLSWTGVEIVVVVAVLGVGLLVRWLRGGSDGAAARALRKQNKADFERDKWDREEARRIADKWRQEHPEEGTRDKP